MDNKYSIRYETEGGTITEKVTTNELDSLLKSDKVKGVILTKMNENTSRRFDDLIIDFNKKFDN